MVVGYTYLVAGRVHGHNDIVVKSVGGQWGGGGPASAIGELGGPGMPLTGLIIENQVENVRFIKIA